MKNSQNPKSKKNPSIKLDKHFVQTHTKGNTDMTNNLVKKLLGISHYRDTN
jgi:hypothetical protein